MFCIRFLWHRFALIPQPLEPAERSVPSHSPSQPLFIDFMTTGLKTREVSWSHFSASQGELNKKLLLEGEEPGALFCCFC